MARTKGKQLANAPNGVSTPKINDLAVTTAKLRDLAVTKPKIANGAIDDAKLDPTSNVYQVATRRRWVIGTGVGATDCAAIAAAATAMAGVGEVWFAGGFAISVALAIPSNSIWRCVPGTTFVSSLAGGGTYAANVPFLANYVLSGVGNTTVRTVPALGQRLIRANADVAAGTWVVVGDATLSACAIYQVISSAPAGGGFDLTMDRVVRTHFAINDTILPLAGAPPINLDLDFNGATLSGTGLRAIALLGTRNSRIRGLRVSTTTGAHFDDHCGVELNDGCYNVEVTDCIAEGNAAAGIHSGHFFADSERITIERCIGRDFPTYGIRCNDIVEGAIVDCSGLNNGSSNLAVTSIRGASSDALDMTVTRFTSLGGGEVIVDGNARNTVFTDCCVEGALALGIRLYSGTGTQFKNLRTKWCGSYGMRADVDVLVQGWVSDDCVSGSIINTGTAYAIVDGFAWGQSSTTLPIFGAANVGTGTVLLRNGKSAVGASGGDATAYNASTGTIIRENVICTGRGGYYAEPAASMLIDRCGVDDSACTVANVFGAGAQANYGTIVTNGVTEVVTAYRGMKVTSPKSEIVFSIGVVGGTPSPTYISSVTPGTGFGTKASAGDTGTVFWKDIAA